MNVLFVDEDVAVATMVKVLSNRYPKDVFVLATTLAKARQSLWADKVDLIVMDIWMPPDDNAVPGSSQQSGLLAGLRLLELVASDKNCINHESPYIIYSALVPNEDPQIEKFKRDHETRFFQKPVPPDTFKEIMEKAKKGELE